MQNLPFQDEIKSVQVLVKAADSPILKSGKIALVLAVAVGLCFTAFRYFLLFHSIVELFSVAIAWAIFALAWNSRHLMHNNYLLFLGISYLFVGNLDLLHTLSYKGMNIFQGYGANLPTQLWIAGRYLESLSYLIAPVFLGRRLNPRATLGVYGLIFALLVLMIFSSGLFPVCYVEGQGLTTFKIVSEYVICLILVASLGVLARHRQEFDPTILRLVAWSIGAMIASELAFTQYAGVYDISNVIGHYFKVISFYLLYRAIIATGIVEPFSLVFRDLKKAQEALEKANIELENQVRERTASLETANLQLLQEIEERRKFENSLRESQEKLRHLTAQIFQAQEQERQRIAAELHDDLGQSLLLLRLNLAGMKGSLSKRQAKLREQLEEILKQTQDLVDKVRRISRNLKPSALEDLGLEAALSQLFRDFAANQKLKFDTEMETISPYLSEIAQTHVYRIFQETLTNIGKHAGATTVTVRINRRHNYLHFLIADNGRGFDPDEMAGKAPNAGGMGLASIEERVYLLDGTCEIWSRPGSGTRVSFTLPAEKLSLNSGSSEIGTVSATQG